MMAPTTSQVTSLIMCVLIMILLVVLDIQKAECKATITVRASTAARKPPFNGSIFGKRSNLAPRAGGNELAPASASYDGLSAGDDYMLAKLLQQQEALVEATVNHCLMTQQRSSASGSISSLLCEELLNLVTPSKRSTKGGESIGNWFDQMAA